MEHNSAEAMGLTAYVTMAHLLQELDKVHPGLRQKVLDSAKKGIAGAPGDNSEAILANLEHL